MKGEFHNALSVQEACDLLAEFGDRAKVLAGGTDLMVLINRRLLLPPVLVFIGNCGLNTIKEEGGNLVIGATTTFQEIIESELVQKKAPVLAQAVKTIGSAAIRHMGTVGGNLVNASPAADSAVALLALGAKVRLVSRSGERVVACSDFFTGPGQTVIQPGELLAEVIVPAYSDGAKMAYRKVGQRRAGVCAIASIAVVAETQNGHYGLARLAMGSVAPRPILIKAAGLLAGQERRDIELIRQVAEAAAQETEPIDDMRATAWYRRKASAAIVKQTLESIG